VKQRRSDRGPLLILLCAALLVAFLTGSTSYRMNLVMRHEQQAAAGKGSTEFEAADAATLDGLRGWFLGGPSRRGLREGGAAASSDGLRARNRDAGALSVQLYQQWWLLGEAGRG
jgi:hypothetical protein